MLSQELLKELLDYDAETGEFRWRVQRNSYRGKARPGVLAGYIDPRYGYRIISIEGKHYNASRLAWFFWHGTWPKEFIDHINGKRDDNRLCNLREANNAQNQCNRKPGSVSGYKGVYWHKQMKKWSAEIKHDHIKHYLGLYETAQEAHEVRSAMAKKLHGEFVYERA